MRRPYAAGVVALVTLLLSSAIGVTYVNVDGTTDGVVPPSSPVATGTISGPFATALSPQTSVEFGQNATPATMSDGGADATYIYIGNGTVVNNWPWNSSYASCRFQMMYTQPEINKAGPIVEFAFQNANTGQRLFQNVRLILCHTNVSAVGTNLNANRGGFTPDTVYSAATKLVGAGQAGGWDNWVFQHSFNYDNVNKLLIEYVYNGNPGGTGPQCRCASVSPVRRTWVWDWQGNTGVMADAYRYNARIGFMDAQNDVGVTKIIAPADPYYAFGDTIYPRAEVKNFGINAQNGVPVRFLVKDKATGTEVYNQVVNVDLATNQIDTVDFPLFAPPAVETVYVDTVRTELVGDEQSGNDKLAGIDIKVTNWGAECLTYNDGTFDNAISWVSAGNELAERFFAPTKPLGINKSVLWLSSFSGVDYAAEVRIYGGGTPGQNQLGAWVGNLHSSIWTSLYKNEIYFDPPISVNYDTFFVSYYQTSISPAYPYLGMDYTPPVTTQNDWGKYNGTWGTFPYDGYMDFGLDACYQAPLIDGSVVAINIPAPVEDSNVSFTPQVVIANAGLKDRSNMPVVFDIYDAIGTILYTDTVNSGFIGMGDTKTIDFTKSYAPMPGNYTDSAYTICQWDGDPENDMFVQPLFVRHLDVITQIVSPRMQEVPGLVPVSIRLVNNGNVPAMVPRLDVKIMPSGYSSYLENIAIGVGEAQVVTLGPWVCPAGGHETATAYITYVGDMYSPNDTAVRPITTGIPGWTEMTALPAPPSGKAIKDGANLTYDEGTGLIYASKGNKTGDFYAYSVPLGTWTNKLGIPLGAEGKPPYKGSVACADGAGKLYLTKGNNTVGFWEYDAAANTWTQKTNVPLGSSGKKVKQGAGLAWAGSSKVGHEVVYLLKGYRNEFHRYDPATNSWVQLLDAPIGTASHVKWDAGSWLVADPEPDGHLLYAFKSKYHEFYTYDTDADTWSHAKAAMPIPGSAGNKKAKDGSCGAWYSGKIYAFKGGNTTEFWRYFPLGDSWHKQDDVPLVGTSGSRKKVKAGGSLAGYPGTGIYGFKGNKSLEFWRYTPYEVAAGSQPSRDGVTAGSSAIGGVSFAIAPNPLSGGLATVRYSLPKAGLATLNVFDVAGRTVLSQTMAAGRTGTASLDLRKLEAGVYLVKVTTEGFSTTQKLVVEH